MADAQINIQGGIVAEPRSNTTPNGARVTNLTVRAGRSRKEQDGTYTTLSSTAYDCACWNEVSDLVAAQSPEKGSQVTISGTVTDVRTYQDNQGQTQASVSVNVLGIKVWPKRQQQGGYSAPQGQQTGGYGQQGQPPANDPWAGGNQGGYGGGATDGYGEAPF